MKVGGSEKTTLKNASHTRVNKSNIEKDSPRINKDKINDPSVNISSLSTHFPPKATPATSRLSIKTQTQGMQMSLSLSKPRLKPNSPAHKKLPSYLL